MKQVLYMNSVTIGGQRMYLSSWIEWSQFKRDLVHNVFVWIKLVDVPHSYWSWESIGNIVKAIGRPLTLDVQTATFNPMKYAGVLMDLRYATYPSSIWVHVLNDLDVLLLM